jgi:large-conductance mechanosensitive channel
VGFPRESADASTTNKVSSCFPVFLLGFVVFLVKKTLIKLIKEKHPARDQEKKKERTEIQTKDHIQECRTHNGEP